MGKWKKLTAFAPALAAVIVAACAGISLNGYTAPVYAVEQPEALVMYIWSPNSWVTSLM